MVNVLCQENYSEYICLLIYFVDIWKSSRVFLFQSARNFLLYRFAEVLLFFLNVFTMGFQI